MMGTTPHKWCLTNPKKASTVPDCKKPLKPDGITLDTSKPDFTRPLEEDEEAEEDSDTDVPTIETKESTPKKYKVNASSDHHCTT